MARGTRASAPAKKARPNIRTSPSEEGQRDEVSATSYQQNADRLKAMSAVAGDFKKWRPANKVLRMVEAVPTRFVDYDVATKIGGHPLSRITVVTGPSANGKTEFCLGLGESFLRAGHFFGLLDAERTTPADWVKKLYGDLYDHPGFLVLPADNTYEQARAEVRAFCTNIAEARAKRRLPEDCTGILLVDSIKKLMPKDLMKQLASELKTEDGETTKGRGKKPPRHIDGAGGRAGQIKAAYNAVWMDELVPLLADTRCSLVFIARETKDQEASNFYEDVFKVGGGVSLIYESSLLLRVESRGLWLEQGDGKKRQCGDVVHVGIRKSKVAGKLEPVTDCVFHTSNGRVRDPGFWRERDVLHTALELGVIELKGANYYFDGKRIGLGAEGTLARFDQDPDLCRNVEDAARRAARPST